MRNKIVKIVCFACFLVTGCYKNYTNYYSDNDDYSVAIFSDRSNNLMTCLINGKGWRTEDREKGLVILSTIHTEVYLSKLEGVANSDTLVVDWDGYFNEDRTTNGYIFLHLALPKNFTMKDVEALQGRRIHVDGTNGYFSTAGQGLNTGVSHGTGDIYFHMIKMPVANVAGIISGLFNADFPNLKIEHGRFDHSLSNNQIRF